MDSPTFYQDLWLDFQINRLPHLFVDIPSNRRFGQHFFNSLPRELSEMIQGTPLDTFNWNDARFAWVYLDLIDRLDKFVQDVDAKVKKYRARLY